MPCSSHRAGRIGNSSRGKRPCLFSGAKRVCWLILACPRYPLMNEWPASAGCFTINRRSQKKHSPGERLTGSAALASSRMTRTHSRQRTKRQPPSVCARLLEATSTPRKRATRSRRAGYGAPPIVATMAESSRSAKSCDTPNRILELRTAKPAGCRAKSCARVVFLMRSCDARWIPSFRIWARKLGTSVAAGMTPSHCRKRDRSKAGFRLLGSLMKGWPSAFRKATSRSFGNARSGRTIRQSASSRSVDIAASPSRPLSARRRIRWVSIWSSRWCAVSRWRQPCSRHQSARSR